MNTQAGFVLKVVVCSAVLSFLIKYDGQFLPVNSTTFDALIIVILPTLILSLILSWRWQQQKEVN